MRELFNASWYLGNGGRRSAKGGAMSALVDYAERGHRLHLSPHPLFDPRWYVEQAGRLPIGMSPLEHYVTLGARRGLSPHPLFDPRSEAAAAAPAGANPLVHYLGTPSLWTLSPNELFSGRGYLRRNRDVVKAGVNPLVHYVRRGDIENRLPHRLFDPQAYRSFASLPRRANTLAHYLANKDHRFDQSVAGISFPEHEAPTVSVIVPVHGKWDYTRECLRALKNVRTRTSFEVVVVDDASPDDTGERLAAIPRIRVVTHTTNNG